MFDSYSLVIETNMMNLKVVVVLIICIHHLNDLIKCKNTSGSVKKIKGILEEVETFTSQLSDVLDSNEFDVTLKAVKGVSKIAG